MPRRAENTIRTDHGLRAQILPFAPTIAWAHGGRKLATFHPRAHFDPTPIDLAPTEFAGYLL